MTSYFEAPDGHGESCVWMHTDNGPWCLLRKSDVAGTDRWPDVVARMTGTTITNNDATVERVAAVMYPELMNHDERDEPAAWATADGPHREQWIDAARAVLAALTGVPHD